MKKKSVNVENKMTVKKEKEDPIKEDYDTKIKVEKDDQQSGKERSKKKNVRSGRIIVRNLPFKSSEESIREHFSKFGEITEINILKKGNKLVGCCFIQFKAKFSAAKAIAKLSGQSFMGRPIVVDWALPKDKFRKTIKKELEAASTKTSIKKEQNESLSSSDDENVDYPKTVKEESDESETEDADSDGDEKNDESDSSSESNIIKKSEGSLKIQGKDKNKKFHFQYDPQDVSDGRTVFLKNVPFSANDDDLLKCAKEVGSVVYAVVCIDPLTEHSKGTAFVKFNEKSVVEDLISGKSKLVLKGVKLDPYLALKKTQVAEKNDKKAPKDNRNLYLLREGVILAGTPAAEGVSEGDMSKRLQLEHWKTQTLKNLNKFVSTNRLVVHNVPPFYDDDRLRKVFKDNSPKGSVITESRIIRNLRDIDEKGVGRSKGFGFVTFTKHEHALEALRKINNNPLIFKESKRPIVGFSIENRGALRIKEKRKAKSINPQKKPMTDNASKVPTPEIENKKRKFRKIEEKDVPEYCGNIAKPGVKKMRSGKELKVQASLHHKALVEKKKSKKRFNASQRWKNKKNVKR